MHHQKSQKSIRTFKSQNSINLHRNLPTSYQFIPNPRPFSTKKYISVLKNQLFDGLKKYQWRVTTQFPIVKILSYKITQTNDYDYILEIQTQQIPTLIHDLKELSLHKVLYLLKETMIGYERLYTKYGAFEVNQQMIGINKNNKCKIWLNSQFAKNQCDKLDISQGQFIESICEIFKQKLIINKLSQEFIRQLYSFRSFSAVVRFIDQFAKNHRLTIPSCFLRFESTFPVVVEKEREREKGFNLNMTMNRAPKFLERKRSSPKDRAQSIERLMNADKQKQDVFPFSAKKAEQLEMSPKLKQELKISGQTRVDLKQSNTNTVLSQSNDKFSPVNIFRSQRQLLNSPTFNQINRSERFLQFKAKQSKIKRLPVSNNPFTCFTPPPSKCQDFYSNNTNTWNMTSFLNNQTQKSDIIKEEDYFNNNVSDFNKNEIQNDLESLFQKNNWQNKIDGLFSKENPLKTSFQEGDEPRWKKDENSRELDLLNSIRRQLCESTIISQ